MNHNPGSSLRKELILIDNICIFCWIKVNFLIYALIGCWYIYHIYITLYIYMGRRSIADLNWMASPSSAVPDTIHHNRLSVVSIGNARVDEVLDNPNFNVIECINTLFPTGKRSHIFEWPDLTINSLSNRSLSVIQSYNLSLIIYSFIHSCF